MPRLAALVFVLSACVSSPPDAGAIPAPGAPSCPIFPANSFWHADVRSLPVHPRSADWIRSMGGPNERLHPDMGPSDTDRPYGIPYDVVDASHDKVQLEFEYADESDPGPYPFGPDIAIEGGSDRHALMLHRDECRLYELFAADWNGGNPTAGSGAIFDLNSNRLRPRGWTSADAGGFSVFAGLIRRDEVEAGVIDHAIRFTANPTQGRYIWPARHEASSILDRTVPPMGAWFRLKGSFPISAYRLETRVVLRAMKVHGLLLVDNGSNWFFGGASEHGWTEAVLDELKSIPAGAFQAVDARPMIVSPDSGRVRSAYVGA